MRKLAATLIASLAILSLDGCSEPASPTAATAESTTTTTVSDTKTTKTTKKAKAKRRPKTEAVSKQERSTKPFAD